MNARDAECDGQARVSRAREVTDHRPRRFFACVKRNVAAAGTGGQDCCAAGFCEVGEYPHIGRDNGYMRVVAKALKGMALSHQAENDSSVILL
jgi:hypothetical protein